MDECDWKYWSICNRFGITIFSLATYYPGVSAHVSLKVTTKNSFRRKNTMKI